MTGHIVRISRRRPELRLDRLQQHLRHRPAAVRDHPGPEHHQPAAWCAASARCTNEPRNLFNPILERQPGRRHRTGSDLAASSSWPPPCIGMVALAILLLNILEPTALATWRIEIEVDRSHAWRRTAPLWSSCTKDGTDRQSCSQHISHSACARWRREQPLAERSQRAIYELVYGAGGRARRSSKPGLLLRLSLLHRDRQRSKLRSPRSIPNARLEFRSWLNPRFHHQPAVLQRLAWPGCARLSSARCGSILHHHPGGLPDRRRRGDLPGRVRRPTTWLNRIIQTNINNLAGVPSIIYGMLGLAIFVRALEPLTSGAIFGSATRRPPTGAPSSPPG